MARKTFKISLVVLALLSATAMRAQFAPYAMFSAGHYSGLGVGPGTSSTQSGGITPLGGTFGLYDDAVRLGPARLGGDARFVIENTSNSTPYGNKLEAGFFGLRLDGAGIPAIPFNPYAQLELGVVGTNNGTSYTKTTSFSYQVQFGSDFSLLIPFLKARLEYGVGQVDTTGARHTLQTFGAGLVLVIPGSRRHGRY